MCRIGTLCGPQWNLNNWGYTVHCNKKQINQSDKNNRIVFFSRLDYNQMLNYIVYLFIFYISIYCLVPGKLQVSLELLSGTTIQVSWKLDRKNGIIQAYYLTYTRVDDPKDTQTIKTPNTRVIVSGLKPGKTYKFVVSVVFIRV